MPTALRGSTSVGGKRLRVGILVDSLHQPAWVARALEDALALPHVELALVVRRAMSAPSVSPKPPRGAFARVDHMRRIRAALLYELYSRVDKRLFPLSADPFKVVDIAPLVVDCPVIDVAPRETRFRDFFSDSDVDVIAAHDLDVAVRFGFRILGGRALKVARHGVWSWHHGDNQVNRGGPPGFWEVIEGIPVTGSILQILSEELDAGGVLYRSWSLTDPHSVARNRSGYYWKSAAFLRRALERLHEQGHPVLVESPDEAAWRPYSHRFYRAPSNGEMLRGITRVACRYAHSKTRKFIRPEQWFIAYRIHPPGAPPDVPESAPYRFRELLPPNDRFWADPFPILQEGRHWIFFEEKISSGRAHIAVVEVGADGMIGEPARALERPYHLSYPFVFEWQGTTYMVPETEEHRTVELYRAEEFPTRWTLDRVLLSDLRAVDATLAEIDDRWWMFVNIAEFEAASINDELHIYFADSPLGPWLPHKQNPVKSDVRSARPAGRPFHFNGAWYRPSQRSYGRYGGAIMLNRITRLDEVGYAEEEVACLWPAWRPNLVATHTLNAAGGMTVIDARRWRFRVPWPRAG